MRTEFAARRSGRPALRPSGAPLVQDVPTWHPIRRREHSMTRLSDEGFAVIGIDCLIHSFSLSFHAAGSRPVDVSRSSRVAIAQHWYTILAEQYVLPGRCARLYAIHVEAQLRARRARALLALRPHHAADDAAGTCSAFGNAESSVSIRSSLRSSATRASRSGGGASTGRGATSGATLDGCAAATGRLSCAISAPTMEMIAATPMTPVSMAKHAVSLPSGVAGT